MEIAHEKSGTAFSKSSAAREKIRTAFHPMEIAREKSSAAHQKSDTAFHPMDVASAKSGTAFPRMEIDCVESDAGLPGYVSSATQCGVIFLSTRGPARRVSSADMRPLWNRFLSAGR
jgi:hypothetical protein